MILLDRPYVSKHFLSYLERSGQPVLDTPFTAELARDYALHLVDDAEVAGAASGCIRLRKTRWNGSTSTSAICRSSGTSTP